MGERTSYPPGTFCWADLGTDDAPAAVRFYGELFGWEAEEVGGEGVSYMMLRRDGLEVAALYPKPDDAAPTAWLSYVAVEDVDAAVARVGDLGGTRFGDPFDAGPHGRGAVVADPTGAAVGLWQAGAHPGARLVNAAGAITWNELNTRDVAAAAAFHRELFGWTVERIPGAEPAYWSVQNGDRPNGGMRELDPQGAAPFWLLYFAVDDVPGTAERVRALGGGVLLEPISVPAGRFAVVHDPQRGVFGLFAGELDD